MIELLSAGEIEMIVGGIHPRILSKRYAFEGIRNEKPSFLYLGKTENQELKKYLFPSCPGLDIQKFEGLVICRVDKESHLAVS